MSFEEVAKLAITSRLTVDFNQHTLTQLASFGFHCEQIRGQVYIMRRDLWGVLPKVQGNRSCADTHVRIL
jgi:hypothetical protein